MGADRAPRAVALIRDFVNSLELEADGETDDWADPGSLTAWLAGRAMAPDAPLDADDLERARSVRKALRAMLLANHDAKPVDEAALRTINRAARTTPLALRFDQSGARLEPTSSGIDAAIGRVLAAVHAAMADGTWHRLKACRRHSCRWAFYDESRNRSRNWCSMEVCGNREKAETYRERHSH